ncbi:MAG: hypothetical protein ABIJ84_04465 [bacterium]
MKSSVKESLLDTAKLLGVSASELDTVLFHLKVARDCCDRMDVCFEVKDIKRWLDMENSYRKMDELREIALADIGTSEEELSRLVQTGIKSFESSGGVHLVDSKGDCICMHSKKPSNTMSLVPIPTPTASEKV